MGALALNKTFSLARLETDYISRPAAKQYGEKSGINNFSDLLKKEIKEYKPINSDKNQQDILKPNDYFKKDETHKQVYQKNNQPLEKSGIDYSLKKETLKKTSSQTLKENDINEKAIVPEKTTKIISKNTDVAKQTKEPKIKQTSKNDTEVNETDETLLTEFIENFLSSLDNKRNKEFLDIKKIVANVLENKFSQKLLTNLIVKLKNFSAKQTSENNLSNESLNKFVLLLEDSLTKSNIAIKDLKDEFISFLTDKINSKDKPKNIFEKITVNHSKKKTASTSSKNLKVRVREVIKEPSAFVSRETNNTINETSQNKFIVTEKVMPAIEADAKQFNNKNNISKTITQSLNSLQQSNINASDKIIPTHFESTLSFRNALNEKFDAMMQKARVLIRNKENVQLTTQLNPKELGRINLRLALIDGQLHAKLLVDNEAVLKALEPKLEQVMQSLRADGFNINQFDVNVRDQFNSFSQSNDGGFKGSTDSKQSNKKQEQNYFQVHSENKPPEGMYA